MVSPEEYLAFKHPHHWRQWLVKHHARATEAWLIIFKKKYQEQGLSLDAAIEEALCFGWIDGQLKSLDEQCYALRFSPRTAQSIWSMSNIRRVEKLLAADKMTAAGRQKIAEAQKNGAWEAALRREQVEIIPEALERALRQVAGGLAAYRALPASRKKTYIYWLQTAKRAETKQRRIQQILEEVLHS